MKISAFKTDDKLETSGVWVDVADLRLRIARMNNPQYEACFRKLSRPHVDGIAAGLTDLTLIEDLMKQAMSQTILLDWDNLQDEDGKAIVYSKEKALELLRTVPDFYRMVLRQAQDREKYLAGDLESAKNFSNG